jgi:hypothetical protein
MPTSPSTEHALAAIAEVITPFVGATMARAAVHGFSTRLQLTRPRLVRTDAQALIEALAPALDVYVGGPKAKNLVEAMWRAFDALEEK